MQEVDSVLAAIFPMPQTVHAADSMVSAKLPFSQTVHNDERVVEYRPTGHTSQVPRDATKVAASENRPAEHHKHKFELATKY